MPSENFVPGCQIINLRPFSILLMAQEFVKNRNSNDKVKLFHDEKQKSKIPIGLEGVQKFVDRSGSF